jgi:hypothetical protein
MLLDGIALAGDPWNIISVATDGIQSTCELNLPMPPSTGTEEIAKLKNKFPLGAWESKEKTHNHTIRPGMRFSLDLTAKQDTTAARGLGVRVLHSNRALVLEEWAKNPMKDVKIQQPTIFMGCKISIRASMRAREALQKVQQGKCDFADIVNEVQGGFERDEKYGTWQKPEPRNISYNPMPKRPNYERGTYRMFTWALPASVGESMAYGKAKKSELVKELEELKLIEAEQPDQGGFHMLDTVDQ